MAIARKKINIVNITLGGLFIALFFIASNIIPPITIITSIPITLQIFVLAFASAIMGVKGGLMMLTTLYFMTIAGIPMMSQFKSSFAVFTGPTGGYIIGFIFIVLLIGIYSDIFDKKIKNSVLKVIVFTVFGIIGVLLDYTCGAFGLTIYTSSQPFFAYFLLNLGAYLWLDVLKIIFAAILFTAIKSRLPYVKE